MVRFKLLIRPPLAELQSLIGNVWMLQLKKTLDLCTLAHHSGKYRQPPQSFALGVDDVLKQGRLHDR